MNCQKIICPFLALQPLVRKFLPSTISFGNHDEYRCPKHECNSSKEFELGVWLGGIVRLGLCDFDDIILAVVDSYITLLN